MMTTPERTSHKTNPEPAAGIRPGPVRAISAPGRNIVLFDGICNLCTGSVLFILKHDREAVFRFASLQSTAGREILGLCGMPAGYAESILYIEDGQLYTKSEAALRIARRLDGLWPGLAILRILPASLRDELYDWIARNRYEIFGKRRSCMVPTAALAARFL
jgi:predicted DCC family thiol-disulfide oxidoreductase YuxK